MELPLFPIGELVLLPGMGLPLYVFEPRYRELLTRVRASTTEAQRLRPRHIDLKYVVTVHFKSQLAELEQQEWEVLWRVLATLMRNSSWPSSMVPQEALALDSDLQAYVAYPEGAPRQGEIWTTLGTSPRPSLHYVLTAPLDLNIEYLKTLVSNCGWAFRTCPAGSRRASPPATAGPCSARPRSRWQEPRCASRRCPASV